MEFYITPEEYETAEKNGISSWTLEVRVRDLLWDKGRAITELPQYKDYSNSKMADIAESNGIKRGTFFARVRRGMSPEKAATKKMVDRKKWSNDMRKRRRYKYPKHYYKTAKKHGVPTRVMDYRLQSGNFTLEQALTMPVMTGEQCARRAHQSRRGEEINAV